MSEYRIPDNQDIRSRFHGTRKRRGIDLVTLPGAVKAGANVLVIGNAIFGHPDPEARVKEMLESIATLGYHSNYV